MNKYLKNLPQELKTIISLSLEVSRETGMPAYLVGGCLRDLILGVDNFDLDITVEGNGIIFAEELAKKLKSGLRIHQRFGTATLKLAGRLKADGVDKVDIATTRQEKYPFNAALPVVSCGLLTDDLRRRDFTINAMALSIAKIKVQKLIDPYGGREDLAAGKIRILHPLSFQDDPTRILRAIRFSQRFSFKIESKTLKLLKEAISQGLLNKVHPHRMRDELILMFKEKNPVKQIKLLRDLGGLSFISNKLKFRKSTYSLFKSIDREILWFTKKFPAHRHLDTWLIYFAALLKELTLSQVKEITHRLGLGKGEEKRIISYRKISQKFIGRLCENQVKPTQIFSWLEPLSYEVIILLGASMCNVNLKRHIVDFFEIYNGMQLHVSGNDLVSLGILPGPRYKKIFAKVLAAKLNGQVKNRQGELALIRKLVKNNILEMELKNVQA
jgi:tRNA nucleotidyltransferase (CCA-adding enzyme)